MREMPDPASNGDLRPLAADGAERSEMMVLVLVQPDGVEDVAAEARTLPGVIEVLHVTGPYDLVVRAVGRDRDDLRDALLRPLGQLDGVRRVLACSVVRLPERVAA
jgi:DNA-binding Lrp family transcriptional regulator